VVSGPAEAGGNTVKGTVRLPEGARSTRLYGGYWRLENGNVPIQAAPYRGDTVVVVEGLKGGAPAAKTLTVEIARSDGQVREFNGRLADVTGFLAAQRGELGGALADLARALGDLAAFVKDNRAALHHDVDGLADVTATLVDQQRALTEVIGVGPAALSSLAATYNGSSGTLDTRPDINELANPPLVTLCKLLGTKTSTGVPAAVTVACGSLSSVVSGAVPLPSATDVLTALYANQPPPVAGLALPTVSPPPGVGSTPPTVPQPPSRKTTGGSAPPLSPILGLLGGSR